MSENNDQPPVPESNPESSDNSSADNHDLIAELKKGLEATRLPPDVRDQILAQLPPPEEQERMLREL
jgi:hypothetical protein